MGPQIAALGSNGVDAFRKLETQAKATGLQLSEILGLVEKFDKFDTAAQAVGKLNALLGGPYLNTLELVAETDPSKRFEILKDRVDDAGLSFDTMDYYQKKALASAMGLNEQQLALMMRGRLDLIQEPAKSAAEIEDLAQQTANFNTIMEELSQLAKGLAISFGPLISMLKQTLQFFSGTAEALGFLIPTLGVGQLAIRGFSFSLKDLAISTSTLTAAQRTNIIFGGIAVLAAFLPLLEGLGKYAKSVAIGIGAITIAVYALSAAEKTSVIMWAAGLIIAAFAGIAHAMTVGHSPSLVQAFMMVAAAVPIFSLALLGLLPILPALLLMIPPLVFGFTMLSEALTEMLSDQFVTNLQLMAVEIANIVDKINELSATKAIAFTAAMAPMAAIAMSPAGAVAAAATAAMSPAASPAAAAAPTPGGGASPTINVHLSIDGTEFATAVNKVEVEKYSGGAPSDMYATIMDMIEQGFIKGT
jgi:hypothetical protein